MATKSVGRYPEISAGAKQRIAPQILAGMDLPKALPAFAACSKACSPRGTLSKHYECVVSMSVEMHANIRCASKSA